MAMKPLLITQRCSYGYTSGWAHLDQWADVAIARQTRPVLRAATEDGDGEYRLLVEFSPAEWALARRRLRNIGQIELAIGDTFVTGCTHEHDCCGCISQSGYATYLGKRKFSVTLYRTRNI